MRRVLPVTGQYIAVSIQPGTGVREIRGLQSITALAHACQRLSQCATNVFFAVGAYASDRKHPTNKRALFLDLDAKSFGSKAGALQGLSAWLRTTGVVAPSIYVDSGRGIHVYWCLDRDINLDAWRAIAGKLKERCVSAGFNADPTVTADAARILRVPGTLNHKESPPIPCRVLKDTGTSYDPAVLLRSLIPVVSSAASLLSGSVGADDLGSAPSSASYPAVPYYGAEIARKCGVMGEAVATGGKDHTEPAWRHLLSLLTFCEDGKELIHPISKGHAGYTEASTEAKYAQVLKLKEDGKLKPILCSTFETYKASICAQCAFKGNIKTPMVLGKLETTQFLPYNYRAGDYSIDKLIKKGDAETPDVWVQAFPYRISEVEVFNHGHTRQIQFTASSKTIVKRVDIESGLLVSQGDGLPQSLSNQGLWLQGTQVSEFKIIMTSWLRRMQDVKSEVVLEMKGLGWGKRNDKDVFSAGGKVFAADGKTWEFYHQDQSLIKTYTPKGDPNVWKSVAQALASDPRQAAVTTLLTSFAAPLVSFAGVKGLTFSLYSADSGTGKSSILRCAQSVWGQPTAGMAMVNDTQLSVINRLGFLNTIPAYWDELRSGDTLKNFVQMIFTLGQGREKSRLTSTIKQQGSGTWDTLVTVASNEMIADHIDTYIKNSDSGRLRLFEVSLPPLRSPDPSIGSAIASLEKNYGHASLEWGAYLAKNRELVSGSVTQLTQQIRESVAGGSNERFWIAFVAVILAAAEHVTAAGILTIDIPKLKQWLLSEYMKQQGGVKNNYVAPEDAATQSISGFVDAHRDALLVVDKMYPAKGLMRNIMMPANQLPRGEIVVMKSTDDKIVRIDRQAWRSWVVEAMKHSPSALMTHLTKLGVKASKAALSAGLNSASNARVMCLEVDLTQPPFDKLIDQ